MRQLRSEGLDVGVVIIGEGPARHDLESLIRHLGLRDRVRLPGHIRPPQRLYGNAVGRIRYELARGDGNGRPSRCDLMPRRTEGSYSRVAHRNYFFGASERRDAPSASTL